MNESLLISFLEFYAQIESGQKVEKSPRLDVWGFALILQVKKTDLKMVSIFEIQEVLTLEHAFGRFRGQPALHAEIRKLLIFNNVIKS